MGEQGVILCSDETILLFLNSHRKNLSKVFPVIWFIYFYFLFLNRVCSISGFSENSWWVHPTSKHTAVFLGQSLTCWAWKNGCKSVWASFGPTDLSLAVCCCTNPSQTSTGQAFPVCFLSELLLCLLHSLIFWTLDAQNTFFFVVCFK